MSTPQYKLDKTEKNKTIDFIVTAKGTMSAVIETASAASAALTAAPAPQGVVSATASTVETSSVIPTTKIPITIFVVAQNHQHSVFFEKALEEIGRMHNAGISMSFALEEPHDLDIYGRATHYFKATFNGDKVLEPMVEKILEFSCSIGPTVTREQIEQFLKSSKLAETAKKYPALVNYTFNNVIKKSDQDEVPQLSVSQMYGALSLYRNSSVIRYLQNRKLSCVGVDVSRKDRAKFYSVPKSELNELLDLNEDVRIAEMTKRLSAIVTNMPNTGGVIWALNFGSFHLHRLGAWMLRESRRNPKFQKYDIQLKLIYGITNRKILTKSGIDVDASVLHSFEADLAKTKEKDSAEIRALYSEIPCHTLMFQKKENGTFGATCPELNDMVTQAITRHKANSKLVSKTPVLAGSEGAPATATATASATGGDKTATGSTAVAVPLPTKTDGSAPLMYSEKGTSLSSTSSTTTISVVEVKANGAAIQITEKLATRPSKPKILGKKSLNA